MQWIGRMEKKNCFISPESPNQSILMTGISGSGKTTRLYKLEMHAVQRGKCVIVLDVNNTHNENLMWPQLQQEYSFWVNRIDPLQDGCALDLFRLRQAADGRKEEYVFCVNSAVKALSSGQRLGTRQIGALRVAVEYAIQNRAYFRSDAEALVYALAQQDSPYADAVYERLWALLNCGALKNGCKSIKKGAINIVDLSYMDIITRQLFSELFLNVLWRNIIYQDLHQSCDSILLVLDEFQNFLIQKDGTLMNMLAEGRKFSLQLLLSTQTLGIFSKEIRAVLNQSATRLYFRPEQEELAQIARLIAPEDSLKWKEILSKLQIGEAVTVGDLLVNSSVIRRPIVTH